MILCLIGTDHRALRLYATILARPLDSWHKNGYEIFP